MLRSTSILLTLPFFAGPDAVPRLEHKQGAVIQRTFRVSSHRAIESGTLSLMGNDQDLGSGSERRSISVLEVVDTIEKVASGRATAFVRAYNGVATQAAIDGIEASEGLTVRAGEGASELQGAAVAFRWDAEGEAWQRAFAEDSAGDEEWLAGLRADLDLADLIPADAKPEVGDTWTLDAAFLSALLEPGGEVQIRPEDGGPDMPEGGIAIRIPSPDPSKHWAEAVGEISATYAEVVGEGPRLARIVVKVDVTSEVDLRETLAAEAEERGTPETYSEATATRELAGELTVLWDLDAHRLHSLEGELAGPTELSVSWAIDAGGMELEVTYAESATQTFTLEASAQE